MSELVDRGPGLWPLRSTEGGLALAIKSSADLAFAVSSVKSIKFHFCCLAVGEARALGVITAIYHRNSSPLTVVTICRERPMQMTMLELVSNPTLGIYFFDTHNSELFGGEWALAAPPDLRKCIDESAPTENSDSLETGASLEFHVALIQRFSNPSDDGVVVEATLTKASRPEGVTMLHVTSEEVHSRKGEGFGIYQSRLEVKESPGDLHEAEIARLLASVYPHGSVFVNPKIGENAEFCDVLALGKVEALAIQAKSTLRTRAILEEDDSKGQARLDKHFRKALCQAKGAERTFYVLKKQVHFGGEAIGLKPETKLLIHLIVIHEKHPVLLPTWSQELASFASETTPVVVLSTSEFINMLNVYRSREQLLNAIWSLAEGFQKHTRIGEYVFHPEKIASFG